jgi:hypothetical protein
MPSRLGSPNKKTLRLQELSEKYGVDPVEVQYMIMMDLKKTVDNEINKPRSRRSKRYFEAEAKLCEVAKEVAPYVHSRRAAVTTVDETPRLTVIRAPEGVVGTQEWLATYAPKHDDAINNRLQGSMMQTRSGTETRRQTQDEEETEGHVA